MRKFSNETMKFYNTKEELSGQRKEIHKEWKESTLHLQARSKEFEETRIGLS